MDQSEIVIIGGGVIGLSIAYALAREGVTTTVLDRRELGREASWAGAGLIPALAEHPARLPLSELRSWSVRLYPEWSAALRDETGIDNGYRRTGGVDVGWTPEEDQALRSLAGRWKGEGIAYERLAPGDFRRVEPALNPSLHVVYFLPDRAQIRNPRHLRALSYAAAARGARLRPGCALLGFETAGDRVTAVRTGEGRIACGTAIVAAGAWSSGLLESIGVHAPTPPLKGQIVLLRTDRPVLSRIVEHGKNYLVPRDDGRILVGATEESAGFDTRTTSSGVRDLLDEALGLCPALTEAEIEKAWAGLRPGNIDGRPYLGAVPGYQNLYLAAGHKRAGLQLSPATAEVMVDLVLGRPPRIDITAFRLDREPANGVEELFRS